jgi:hypothetical protein
MQATTAHVDHPAGRRIAAQIGGRSHRLANCRKSNENDADRSNQQ